MNMHIAAVHESACGTKRSWRRSQPHVCRRGKRGKHQLGMSISHFDPLRNSSTGSGSGSGRLVVEIVGGVTEVSLHVRYGGSGDLGRPRLSR